MKIQKRTALTIIFVAICITSTIYLASATFNYIEFFRALERFNLKLRNVSVVITEVSIKFIVKFEMINPTSYVGLKLREVSYLLNIQANDESVDLTSEIVSYAENPITINPYWNHTFEPESIVDASRPVSSRFLELYRSYQGKQVTWNLSVIAILLTFAGKVDVPLSASIKSAL